MKYYQLWIHTCNIVLFMSIVVFVGISSWIMSDDRFKMLPIHRNDPTFIYAYFALTVQGGCLQLVGCIGALRLSERLLQLYWIYMLILLAGDVIIGIFWAFKFDRLMTEMHGHIMKYLREDYLTVSPFYLIWDAIQIDSECCGVDGPKDFINSSWYKIVRLNTSLPIVVPGTCCKPPLQLTDYSSANATCIQTYDVEYIHTAGCFSSLKTWVHHSADILFILGYCVIAFLKACFLGILKNEIREMIKKIRMRRETQTPSVSSEDGISVFSNSQNTGLFLTLRRWIFPKRQDKKVRKNGNNNTQNAVTTL